MGLLGWEGLQRFWNKVKALVQPYVKDASLDGNTLTFTKGTGETKSFTIEGGSASNTPTYSEGLRYQLTTDKTGYAVTNIGTCTDTDIIIPPIYNGLPVKEIFGWSNTTTIISVTLPNSIISMGNYVFKGCSNLIKIIIPDSVTTIGQDIFNECPNVTVYCEAKSKPEGWHSRWDMSARHVVWNAFDFIGVHEHIENDLSEYVTEAELEEKGYLTETELGEKGYATEEYVDEKVSSMSGGTSSGGNSSIIDLGAQENHKDAQQAIVDHLTQMNAEDGCYLFKYYCQCYGNGCFAVVKCRAVDDIVYFEGTVYDNYRSFRQFQYNTVDGFYLDGCWLDIASFNETLDGLPTDNKDVIGAIHELSEKTHNYYSSGIDYAYTSSGYEVTGIGTCTDTDIAIKSEHLGTLVVSTGFDAFLRCETLTSVVIPDSVITIGTQSFFGCVNLTNVVIPKSVGTIRQGAFRGCLKLTNIVIPDSVTSISTDAFRECENLTIYCEAPSKPSGWADDWNPDNRPVVWGFANNFIDVNKKLAEIGTGGSGNSGGAGLSMPRIRLANWHYTELPRISFDENGILGQCSGGIIFSVNIQDGTVQEGDQLQVCSIRNTFGKKKLRPILSKTITAEDIENLAKQPYLQVSTEDVSGNNLAQTTSQAIGSFYHTDSKDSYRPKPKYIRIRRPVYTEDGYVANAFFSNVVPVEIVLRYEII